MMKRFILILSFVVVALTAYRFGQESIAISAGGPLDFSATRQVWDVVSQNYLRSSDVDLESVKYGLAKGLVKALGDEHSNYMAPDEAKAFMVSLNGDLQGIGAVLRLKDDLVTVINPLPDSPAEKAGIRPGDIIIKIDGKSLGLVSDLTEVVMMIRGPKGSTVNLTVIHAEDPSPVDLEIERDEIHVKAVDWSVKEFGTEKIAYLQLSSFTEGVSEEFEQALKEINAEGHDRLILDLRHNGGGYLEAAVEILSHFVPADKPVVYIKDRDGEISRDSIRKTVQFRGNIVVLVNDSSASASEIVAGALRDYDLAHLIGVKTYGKGSVQEVNPFRDESMLRLTIAEWMTPLKKNIESVGIEPDQILELDFDAYREGKDNQLDAALEFLTAGG